MSLEKPGKFLKFEMSDEKLIDSLLVIIYKGFSPGISLEIDISWSF